jgi:hypothetical protein
MQESQVLRVDMDGMRSRVLGLERECSSMRGAIMMIDSRRRRCGRRVARQGGRRLE